MKNIQNIDNFIQGFQISRDNIKAADITIETNENTYLPLEEMKTGWLQLLYSTFSKKQINIFNVKSISLVGIGAGVESFLFIERFKPKKLYALDINRGVIPIAKRNIELNLKENSEIDLIVEHSDLLEFLTEKKIKVDLIYENLPNLKLSTEVPIEKGLTSSSFYSEVTKITIPVKYELNMLRLHYRFLLQAKESLNSFGSVICCIGGRIPIDVVKSMFDELGYDFKLLSIGIVQQLCALEVVDTYKEIESRTGMQFLFLPHQNKKIKEIIKNYKAGDDLSQLFESCRKHGLSATQAYVELSIGKNVDHLGLIIQGTLRS